MAKPEVLEGPKVFSRGLRIAGRGFIELGEPAPTCRDRQLSDFSARNAGLTV
jgi:hypothetical protein